MQHAQRFRVVRDPWAIPRFRNPHLAPGSHGSIWNLPAAILAGLLIAEGPTPELARQKLASFVERERSGMSYSDLQRLALTMSLMMRW